MKLFLPFITNYFPYVVLTELPAVDAHLQSLEQSGVERRRGVQQGLYIFGEQFGEEKGSNRQSMDRAGGRSGGGHYRSLEGLYEGFL